VTNTGDSSHNKTVRSRFSPSPTGLLHLGGLRTALFAWLTARHADGQFLLRIEDTDQKRLDPASLEDFKTSLRWLGLDWDEGPQIGGDFGPYTQSERQDLYHKHADVLIESGHAYRCYCTAERLAEMRQHQEKNKLKLGYDGKCRHLSDDERAEMAAQDLPSVVRFAMPQEGETTFHDLIRGDITVENSLMQDWVLLKADGFPTYHLAVTVDDHLMEISHVLRGQEWLGTAPLHHLLYDAFGWERPVFVHLPVILDPGGKGKMSKRKKVVGGKEHLVMVHEFIEAGYLPDAMFNFLCNVGWNFDAEQEIFTRDEAIARFDVKDINPSAAAMSYEKLEWTNGMYIRNMDPADLKAALIPYIAADLGKSEAELAGDQRLDAMVPLIQERITLLPQATEWIDFVFKSADEITYPDPTMLIGKKLDAAQSAAALSAARDIIQTIEPFEHQALQDAMRTKVEELEMKVGPFLAPLRVSLSGKKVSPPLFETIEALGREEVLSRVENGLAALESHAAETA